MPFTLAHATKRRLRRQFEQRGVRHFLPLYQEIPRWNNRSAGVSLPLFPGFVFVRTSNRNRYEPLQVPGVLHYVGTGAAQCPIPDEEIEVLRRVLISGKDVGPHPYLRIGRSVRIASGPLEGLCGIMLALLTRNLQLMRFYAVHVVLFAVSAALFVPWLGYIGYGWAELTAFAAYYFLHHYICLSIGSPDYSPALLWFAVCSIAIVIASTPAGHSIAALLLLLVPLVSPRERTSIEGYMRILLRRRSELRLPVAARY
jgi:transcription antitermination factor NusG